MTSNPASSRSLVVPGILAAVAFVVLVSLGNWQIDRLAWKEDLIARATERPTLQPVAAPPPETWPALDMTELEYRPLRLTGEYLGDREVLVFTSLTEPVGQYGGPGFWVVTPFLLQGGGTVLVNRGFVPQDRRAPADRAAPPAGPVSVVGLARPSDSPNFFTPDDRPADNIFFARNVEAIAAAKGLPGPVAPFTVDLVAAETPPGGLPQAGATRFRFTNTHLSYALTWYGLAVALLAVFATLAWTKLKASRAGSA